MAGAGRAQGDGVGAGAVQPDRLVYAHNDPGAHGAYLAAKAAGREKQIMFVGIDALPQEGVAYVREGVLGATFQYPTGGAEAIATAADSSGRTRAEGDHARLARLR